MVHTFSKALVAVSLLGLAACGQQQKEAPKPAAVQSLKGHFKQETRQPTRAPEQAALSCDQIWTGFVAANPVGLSQAYEYTTTTEYTGGEGLPAPETLVETAGNIVTASSDASVTIQYSYFSSAEPTPVTQDQSITKVDFLASCNAPVAPEAAPVAPAAAEPTVEIVGEGTETVTVRAGTFETEWVKGTVTQTGAEPFTATAQEWYQVGTDLLVKSTSEQIQSFGTISIKSTQTAELVTWVVPAPAS